MRWGILATGKIAGGFAENLALLPDAEIAAVAARRLEPARSSPHDTAPGRRTAATELVADPDVDVVYVATPHALHHEHVLLALEAGKPVLCEKAFTLNEAQAVELVAAARERGLFLMEAMWMRCHLLVRRLQQLLGTGELGTKSRCAPTSASGWTPRRPTVSWTRRSAAGRCSTWASTR